MEFELNFPGEEIKNLSPLIWAHIGDAYFHLYVRTHLLQFTHNISRLHELSSQIVSAPAQAQSYLNIKNYLTADELDICRRGRNAKTRSPRNSTFSQYHASTGFEALLGYLFLSNNFFRLNFICQLACREDFSHD